MNQIANGCQEVFTTEVFTAPVVVITPNLIVAAQVAASTGEKAEHITPLAATVIQIAVSRSREYEADAGGTRVSGKSKALAGALAKLSNATKKRPMDANPSKAHMFIVNPLSGGTIINLFSTHPPVEKRIERLLKMKKMEP